MKNQARTEYVTRDTILRLLSDEEIARVSTAETAPVLADGEEYIDLDEPDGGVRRASGAFSAPMGRVLPRNAVLGKTWREIVILLAAHQISAAASHRRSAIE